MGPRVNARISNRGRRRADRQREIADRLIANPIVIDGDAHDLLANMRDSVRRSGVRMDDLETATEPAQIVVLAIESEGRSSLLKADRMLRAAAGAVAPDAVRIVVIQSGRSRIGPARLQRVLASEILFQITIAADSVRASARNRSMRQRIGLTTLDAVGLTVLRLG